MEIETNVDEAEKTVVFKVSGRINTATSKDFEDVLTQHCKKCEKMILDLEDVDFISSAGLRVLMDVDAAMKQHGVLILRHINAGIREVLTMTGFIDFLTVE